MAKIKTLYICQQCGYRSPKWLGRCSNCQEWNAMVEELVEPKTSGDVRSLKIVSPTLMEKISLDEVQRVKSGIKELDRVLGGGVVPGSVTLVGGEPGIGKSTLLLSMAGALAVNHSVLYISGEESLRQTKLRATRLGLSSSSIHLLADTRLEVIMETIKQSNPEIIIVDSIQVIETDALQSAPGSIGQVRQCAHELVRLVKESQSALFLVGHITKEGFLAGPKVLEHLVDTVLHFEGEPTSGFRLLRSTKNRFGATYELGVFHMTSEGLIEVSNPSELFLSHRSEALPGCMVTASLEGSRPLLVEIQALTSSCGMGLPKRKTAGVDYNRLAILLAVLERRVGMRQLASQDVFVSSLGGVRVIEPGADLGIAIAIASSVRDHSARFGDLAIGEVALTGEIRPVNNLSQRIHEASRIGFQRCFVASSRGLSQKIDGIEVITVNHLHEAVDKILGDSK